MARPHADGSRLVENRQLPKSDEIPTPEHVADLLLYLLKTHERARLTLKVIKQPRQCPELFATPSPCVRTMINIPLMSWRVEM
jgi:hypothetical protein